MVDLERMLDLTTPWCLHVAATLRIPDRIAAGPAAIAWNTRDSASGGTRTGKSASRNMVTV
jgi:hypothetical protein